MSVCLFVHLCMCMLYLLYMGIQYNYPRQEEIVPFFQYLESNSSIAEKVLDSSISQTTLEEVFLNVSTHPHYTVSTLAVKYDTKFWQEKNLKNLAKNNDFQFTKIFSSNLIIRKRMQCDTSIFQYVTCFGKTDHLSAFCISKFEIFNALYLSCGTPDILYE